MAAKRVSRTIALREFREKRDEDIAEAVDNTISEMQVTPARPLAAIDPEPFMLISFTQAIIACITTPLTLRVAEGRAGCTGRL